MDLWAAEAPRKKVASPGHMAQSREGALPYPRLASVRPLQPLSVKTVHPAAKRKSSRARTHVSAAGPAASTCC